MSNCANRFIFTGVENNFDQLKNWIVGGGISLHQRAKFEGIQLLLAGSTGILLPVQQMLYLPFPALTAQGVSPAHDSASQAFTAWLDMLVAGASLDPVTCETLHQHWLNSGVSEMRWNSLDEYARNMISMLYHKKSHDWSIPSQHLQVMEWWDALCDGVSLPAGKLDFSVVRPSRLDIAINGQVGGLLCNVPSASTYGAEEFGSISPVAISVNICHAGDSTLTVDFDTSYQLTLDTVVSALSKDYHCEVEFWFAHTSLDLCGYTRASCGVIEDSKRSSIEWDGDEWEPEDPEDEFSPPQPIGPEWIIDNVAHFEYYPQG